MAYTQDQGAVPASPFTMPVTWRMSRPWRTLIIPAIVAILILASISSSNAQYYLLQATSFVLFLLLAAYSYRGLSRWNRATLELYQTEFVLKTPTPLKRAPAWQTYGVYGVILVIVIIGSLAGLGSQDPLLSLAAPLPILFLILYIEYTVRRSARPGELHLAKQDTSCAPVGPARLRIKSRISVPKLGYVSMNLDFDFESHRDFETFCQELKS